MSVGIIDRIIINNEQNTDLQFKQLTGEEKLSSLYLFAIDFLSLRHDMDMNALLGKTMSIALLVGTGERRYLHGHISRIEFIGHYLHKEKYKIYRFLLRPALWYLTMNRDCRIWQGNTLPEIITSVLAEHAITIENRLSTRYYPYENCVQYQESAFVFISRLMEHEGIYYYFKHQENGHTLVLCDAIQAHQPFPGYGQIDYQQAGFGLNNPEEGIQGWSVAHEITADLCTLDDYDFRKPRAHLLEACKNQTSHAPNKADLFDWPGRYHDNQHGQFLAKIRQQTLEAGQQSISGLTTARGMAPGFIFTLRHGPCPADTPTYLITGMEYHIRDFRYGDDTLTPPAATENGRSEFTASFTLIPADVTWRPERVTPWPKTHGPQTAEVTGPKGKSIWTDKYGRVKLRFHWDRHGSADESSSCWVRVSSGWAGWKYGSVQVPRVGEEVIVDFINGDPDRPIVIGRVYNEDAQPPWELPANATRMGFMSRSKDGGANNASYLFLEDAPGRETFAMHAERDMTISVEGDHASSVAGNLTGRIDGQTSYTHAGPCATLKMGPDSQIFQLGKTCVISAGGRADVINGGDYRQVMGSTERMVSKTIRYHAGESISHHALDSLMFDAGNKIIYGQCLLPDGENQEARCENSALQTYRAHQQPDATQRHPQAGPHHNKQQPTHILYTKGKNTDIDGSDKLTISQDQTIEVKGAVTRNIHGDCDEHIGESLTVHADGEIQLHSDGKMSIEAKSLALKVQGDIETHSLNSLNIAAMSQNIDMTNFTMSQSAMHNHNLMMSTRMMSVVNTQMQMENVGINIAQGQLNIRTALLTLNTSALTLFI